MSGARNKKGRLHLSSKVSYKRRMKKISQIKKDKYKGNDTSLSSSTSINDHEQITKDLNFSNSRNLSKLNELDLNLPPGWKQLFANNSLIFLKYNEQYEVERKVVIKNDFDVLVFLRNIEVNISDYNTLKELTIDLAIQKCNNLFKMVDEMKVCPGSSHSTITIQSTEDANLLSACDSVNQDSFNNLVIIKEEPLDQNFEIGEERPDIDFDAEETPICDISKEILIKQEPIEGIYNNDNQT